MFSSDETDYSTTGSIDRPSRALSRRELLNSKRRQTDILPRVNGDAPGGRVALRQVTQLREENMRLRRELEELQQQVEEYRSAAEQIEGEIDAIHSGHQQEIEQYQHHLHEMMEEHNQMQEVNAHLTAQYQDLYHTFQDKVEEEADKLVKEAAQTLILSPEHTPALLSDVVKTLESQARQTEDQRTAELLAIMRQAQYKSELLEQEVARERAQLEIERQNLVELQNSIREQAQTRYNHLRAHLRRRWTAALTFMSFVLLLLVPVLQSAFYILKFPLYVSLFVPIFICLGLAYVFARMHVSSSFFHASKPHKKPAKPAQAKPAAATAGKK
jgi:chromosome segregation ATPase